MQILLPVFIIGGLGLIFGFGLAYASKKFEVKVDERVSLIRDVLPGANCAACGQTGCDAFAEAVVAGVAEVNGCPVGGAAVAEKVANIMGKSAEKFEAKVARVMCGGSSKTCRSKYSYSGIEDCAAAASLYGGPSSCTYGCVGMGNCVRACPFGAIVIEDGLAKVIATKCTGCTKCVAACPKKIIEMVPVTSEYTVRCSSFDSGKVVRQNCDVGCIGCGRCAKVCPHNAIKMENNLAKINPALCQNCGECAKVCPTKAIELFLCGTLNKESAAV
ncbi:MAG TPA: RnfABCDGE type electron transport complex subunit B [Clostridiaceae bacterium]|nr:RnfABCDGE type electron transport complex subunit B [Clostridiaceae bacterium]